MEKKLTIIVPIYKSVSNLENNLSLLINYINQLNLGQYEILFISDASPDRSVEYLKNQNLINAKIFEFDQNRGLGAVISFGIQQAKYEFALYLDMDLSYDITNLSKMLNLISFESVIVASKYHFDIDNREKIPFLRQISRKCYLKVISSLSRINVLDIGSGMVLFPVDKFKKYNFISQGFAFHFEFYQACAKFKYKIIEIPIVYKHQVGSFKIAKHLINILKETIQLFFNKSE